MPSVDSTTKELLEPAAFVAKMEPALDRAAALLGGTDAMRQAGEKYLPRFPGEAESVYAWRLKCAVLNNFYEALAGMMVGMMFEKPVSIEKSKIDEAITDNIDKRGGDITAFATELTKSLLTRGRPHILVDHPKKPEHAQTAADDQALGLRPYWVLMEPACVISAWADTENGDERLGHFRWREWGSKRSGGYGVASVERVRLFNVDEDGSVTFEKWERERDDEPLARVDDGKLIAGGNGATPLREIPIVTLYAERRDFMVAKPTLDDIAHKNIEHWQSSADQRHILTVSRFPIMYQIGTDEPVALVGPYTMFHAKGDFQSVRIGYAEAEGKGAEQGWKDMDRILNEAEAMSVRIVTTDAAKTDTGEQADYAKEGSRLQKLAVEVERALNEALRLTALWLGLSEAEAGVITVHKDFGLSSDDAKAIDQLLALREAGDISQGTYWAELVERRLFKTAFNPKKEAQLVDDEKQANIERQVLIGGGGPDPNNPGGNTPPGGPPQDPNAGA